MEEQKKSHTTIVLIAEDDATDRGLLRHAWSVSDFDLRLLFVFDGAEVIAYLTGEGMFRDRTQYPLPEVLVLDLKMPRVDGLQVMHWLEGKPEFSRIELVILTGIDEEEMVSEAKSMPARFWRKPDNPAMYGEFLESLGKLASNLD